MNSTIHSPVIIHEDPIPHFPFPPTDESPIPIPFPRPTDGPSNFPNPIEDVLDFLDNLFD